MRFADPRRSGFTLLEAAIALVILSMVALAAFGAYGAQLRAEAQARALLPAAALAQERLAAVDLSRTPMAGMLPDSVARGEFAPPFAGYAWEASLRAVPREPGLFDVRVAIAWEGGRYVLHTRRFRPSAAAALPRPFGVRP